MAAADIDALPDAVLRETLSICRIPAPTFAEEKRARYIESRLAELGLSQIDRDSLNNVTAVLPGSGHGPTLMAVAHIDTVFPEGTNVEPRWDGRLWHAPGIRDNSASAAVTLLLPELLNANGLKLAGDLILAFSVGEEGLGNLRGARALMERYGSRVSQVLAVDGNLGSICHVGVAVKRLEIAARAEGGHSWLDAGRPSAIHALAQIAGEISRLPLPQSPKSVLNIGTFNGGTSVNAIAQEARLLLDIRSVEQEPVRELETKVRAIVEGVAARSAGVEVTTKVVGDRPGGRIPADHPLVRAIVDSYARVSVRGTLEAGSTDANIPLSLDIPAASIGVAAGGGVHTLDEFLDPDTLVPGSRALVLTLLALQQEARA